MPRLQLPIWIEISGITPHHGRNHRLTTLLFIVEHFMHTGLLQALGLVSKLGPSINPHLRIDLLRTVNRLQHGLLIGEGKGNRARAFSLSQF